MSYKILVGYDFTAMSERALAWAQELVRGAGGEIVLVHVAPLVPPSIAVATALPGGVPASAEGLVPTAQDLARIEERLREIAARHPGVTTVEAQTAMSAGPMLLERAEALKVDLVVLGTHGRGMLARAVMGSVADHVVRHARCPVTTIREHTEGTAGA